MCPTPKILLRVTFYWEMSLQEKYRRLNLPTKKKQFLRQNFASLRAIVAHESIFLSYVHLHTSELIEILLVDAYDIGLKLQTKKKSIFQGKISQVFGQS